jgi:hypothetical protein
VRDKPRRPDGRQRSKRVSSIDIVDTEDYQKGQEIQDEKPFSLSPDCKGRLRQKLTSKEASNSGRWSAWLRTQERKEPSCSAAKERRALAGKCWALAFEPWRKHGLGDEERPWHEIQV